MFHRVSCSDFIILPVSCAVWTKDIDIFSASASLACPEGCYAISTSDILFLLSQLSHRSPCSAELLANSFCPVCLVSTETGHTALSVEFLPPAVTSANKADEANCVSPHATLVNPTGQLDFRGHLLLLSSLPWGSVVLTESNHRQGKGQYRARRALGPGPAPVLPRSH